MHMHGAFCAHRRASVGFNGDFWADHGSFLGYRAPIDANLVCFMKTIAPRGVE